ncbi:uncharacterized protein [Nicotiana tomentosiformis]|uniref:uncharacterized protein n=1 Tax=Nicotiana tomentosiformis TaxID=4098 RepID=UPI00388C6E4E
MVRQVLESHKITFHEDELPPVGLSHNRALHITVQCKNKFIARVLIDGGSSLNICPLTTLKRLGKGLHEIRAGTMNVKAFDGSQRATIGETNLCLQMVPTWFDVEFQVLDISASYNLLLGRPWIHAVGAVDSTLHQAIKFEWNHQEVIIHRDGSNPIYTNQTVPVVEHRRKLDGKTYHRIERINAIEKDKWWSSKIESILAWAGYEPSKGLGKNLQGITKLIQLKRHDTTFGLGYQYTWKEYDDWSPPRRGTYYTLEQPVPHLSHSFHQADMMWESEEDEVLAGIRNLFLDDGDMDCSAIVEEEEEEEKEEYTHFLKEYEDIFAWTQDLPPPKNKKDVMSFLGRLNYISRFITQSTVICEPIFKMLKKDAATSWTEDCQKAFDKIKEYLSTPLVLVPPEPGRPLLLYLFVLDGAFGCVLGQHDETGRKEQAIYYLSKKFTPYEARYSLLERTCCALTWIAQKLRHYFCAYTTYLISRMDPLKYIFQKPMPTGKLAKWKILLSEFDIIYVTQKAVKGHALADHLAENPIGGEYEPLKTYFPDEEVSFVGEDIAESYDGWRMFFDGPANFKGVGIGAILVSETGQHYPASTKLRFPCTNNMAEYEACILGLNLAVDMNIQELLVIGDLDLLVHQVQEEWATKNTKILPYLHQVQEMMKRFTKIEF